jgi:hypothetical protein
MVRIRIIIAAIPVITAVAVTLTTMVTTKMVVTSETLIITTSAVTSVTATSRIALGLRCIGKKAVILNRADGWDFIFYREGDGVTWPLFDKEKLASSPLLALDPLPLKYLGWHSGFNLERLRPKRQRRAWPLA